MAHCGNCYYFKPESENGLGLEGTCKHYEIKHGKEFPLNAFAGEKCDQWVHKNFSETSGAAQRVRNRWELLDLE